MYPTRNGKPPNENYTGIEQNTIKRLVINNRRSISESPEVKLTELDFESGHDFTILVRERTRGSKLQGPFQKRKEFSLNNPILRSHFCRPERQHPR